MPASSSPLSSAKPSTIDLFYKFFCIKKKYKTLLYPIIQQIYPSLKGKEKRHHSIPFLHLTIPIMLARIKMPSKVMPALLIEICQPNNSLISY